MTIRQPVAHRQCGGVRFVGVEWRCEEKCEDGGEAERAFHFSASETRTRDGIETIRAGRVPTFLMQHLRSALSS